MKIAKESIITIACENCKEENKVYAFAKTKKKCIICDSNLYSLKGGKIKFKKVL